MSLHTRPATRTILGLLAVAFAVSVVHYVDNVGNYADFPRSDTVPNPSRAVVGGAWFVFTVFAVAAVVALVRGRDRAAAICLAVYSGSGLVGLGHYTVPGAFDMPWWRQAHVVADIACGTALFIVALRLALSARDAEPAAA